MRALSLQSSALLIYFSSLMTVSSAAETANNTELPFARFIGTTPCDGPIRQLLEIPTDAKSDIVQWTLVLQRDAKSAAPTSYKLRFTYGPTVQGQPGLTGSAST